MTINYGAINLAALMRLPEILYRLLPGGKVIGGEYVVRNPKRADRRAGLFKIDVRTGRWADFATEDAKGRDVISLVAYLDEDSQSNAAKLVKLAVLGGGPPFRRMGRVPLYDPDDLEAWARARISRPRASMSDLREPFDAEAQ